MLVNHVVINEAFDPEEVQLQIRELTEATSNITTIYPGLFSNYHRAIVLKMKKLENMLQRRYDEIVKQTPVVNTVLVTSENAVFLPKKRTRHQPTHLIILQHWYDIRGNHKTKQQVYLTKTDLEYLCYKTGLSVKQIRNWVSNERRRRRLRLVRTPIADVAGEDAQGDENGNENGPQRDVDIDLDILWEKLFSKCGNGESDTSTIYYSGIDV